MQWGGLEIEILEVKIDINMKEYIIACLFLFSCGVNAQQTDFPAPIYANPNYCGSCDPEIVWNPCTEEWIFFYTGRRPALGVAATCGNPIGVATSKDFIHWAFEGYCMFDGEGGKPDSEHTFWAPGVIIDGNEAHMFVTYKEDATPPWGIGGCIAHYKAPIANMLSGWKRVNVTISEDNCLDASVIKLKNGKFRMYYVGGINNPETKGRKTIRYAESDSLYNWQVKGNVLGEVNDNAVHGLGYQEGVYVFQLKGRFYMLTDPHKGLATYSSDDGVIWKYHGQIMQTGTSSRTLDWSQARHPSVIVKDNKAYMVYHVEPFRSEKAKGAGLEKHQRYAFIQMTELECTENGIKRLE